MNPTPNIMLSTSVYGFENEISQICALLKVLGYNVWNSHLGTVRVNSAMSNLENCLKGVENCDVFLGFIRPLSGTGILKPGEKSITAQEFDVAFRAGMPRFVLADYRVVFARQFTNMMKIPIGDIPNYVEKARSDGSMVERPNRVIHSESIELYNIAIKNNTLPISRKGNWVQEYKNLQDVMLHVEAQFKDVERIKKLINEHK